MTDRQEHDMQAELALLARARALEPTALTEIHQQYYEPIYRYIYFKVSDQALAEDLASEVFTRLLSALRDRHAPQNTLRGWLYGVASRVVVDHYRRQARYTETELSERLPSEARLPEEVVAENLSIEAMQNAMHELTEDQQNVLSLRFGLGLRIREVAEAIGKSEGAVKQLQLRALNTLAEQLIAKES